MTFNRNDDNNQRLDYRLLSHSPVTLYWKSEVFEEDISWFQEHDYSVFRLDASKWKSEKQFHQNVKEFFEFPDYYGMNLDAFTDCFYDFVFEQDAHVVIAIDNLEKFQKRYPRIASYFVDVMYDVSRYYLLYGYRLACLIRTDEARTTLESNRKKFASWNAKEWLYESRGIK